jgi:hypothetical protein
MTTTYSKSDGQFLKPQFLKPRKGRLESGGSVVGCGIEVNEKKGADVGAALDKRVEVARFTLGKIVGVLGRWTDKKRGLGYSYIDRGKTCPEYGALPGLLKQSGQKLQSRFF